VRRSISETKTAKKTGNGIGIGIKTAFLAAAVLAAAGIIFYFGTGVHAVQARAPQPRANKTLSSKSLTLPMFFEPNQGQTAPQVKFLARGSGYGLFLTADEAVLQLQPSAVSHQPSATRSEPKTSEPKASSVIRMRLDGANSSARVSGAEPLPGKSNYFIGNDPSKWRHNIPQFARVEYKSVYPGVDLVYYGNQGQLEYDFHVAPGTDPNQIALGFEGASPRIIPANAGNSGDLILSTANGDVRFHALRVYQPAVSAAGNASGQAEKTIAGSFRLLAGNKIGFTVGDYDRSRELVIDPVLSYSTYLGGSATEGGLIGSNPENLVKVAVDSALQIYVAGSTTSTDFPFPVPPNPNNPIQATLKVPTAQNIFIAVINTNPNVPHLQQLVYATYLGGSLVDSLAGLAVDKNRNIFLAGTTTSTDFPTINGLPQPGPVSGTHGFVSAITLVNSVYALTYSTYLAGNAVDAVTGLAIDQNQNAYVTGVTTSSNTASQQSPFPASPNGYQTCPFGPVQSGGTCPASGPPQFFASKINTTGSGSQSMLYSTYFGGGYPANAIAVGGGIAVDPSGPNPNLYITGTTTMLNSLPSGVSAAPFPLLDAQQSCLNEASKTNCPAQTATTTTDAFVAKINPNADSSSSLVYSTYIGAEGDDFANAIDVDTSGNAYVIGSTNSALWVSLGTGFQTAPGGGFDAFVVKIGSIVGTIYPINYFTYLGGSGDDFGEDIKVDSIGTIHAVGTTTSNDLLFLNPLQPTPGGSQYNGSQYDGQQDAFVALIGSSLSGRGAGDYLTYLGGGNRDQGTGVAFDVFGATYVAGTTTSADFPVTTATAATSAAYQPQLNNNSQDAFVSKIGANSTLVVTVPSTSPSPFPSVPAGMAVTFTFDITNMNPNGTDPASQVVFNVVGLPTTGLQTAPTATVQSGSGSCAGVIGSTISCFIPNLAVNAMAIVEVQITPAVPVVNSQISIAGNASANGGPVGASVAQPIENVVDYGISAFFAGPSSKGVINAGDTATIQVKFCPATNMGYTGTITPSETILPSMVTTTAPTFSPTTVSLSGSACEFTTLSIATVARPVTTGSLLRRRSFYAAWLPIGGLSLIGLGLGATSKRRRWMAAAVLGLIAGVILLQPGCGSASTATTATGGTAAGIYTITITGTPGPHTTQIRLQVD
jgi:hypothetical protein